MTGHASGSTDAARRAVVAGLLVLLAGCAKTEGTADRPADSAGAGGMAGMPMQGMGGMAGGDMAGMSAMMAGTQARMDSMMTASPEQMRTMVPMHRQMAANMLAQMTAEMRGMTAPASPAWTATVDSVRQDLVRLPEQGAAQLPDAMKAHQGRMMRLMQMHGEMMKGMKM